MDTFRSKSKVPKDKWSHIAATFDQGKITFYVDGRPDTKLFSKTIKFTNRREYTNDHVTIGGLWNNHYTFDGMIDEVTMHCRPLSADDVRTLFESDGIIAPDIAASN